MDGMDDSPQLRVSPVSARAPLQGENRDDVSCYFLRLTGLPTPPEPWPEPSNLHVVCVLAAVTCLAEFLARQTRFGATLSSSLIAFLLAASISNAFPWLLPTHSPVYDAAWHILVPLILVLLITSVVLDNAARTPAGTGTLEDPPACWPSRQESVHRNRETAASTSGNLCVRVRSSSLPPSSASDSPAPSVSPSPALSPGNGNGDQAVTAAGAARRFQTVGVAFALGAAATILSVAGAFRLVLVVISYSWCSGVFHLTQHIAAMCAACIAATYIGGSINFYAVAKTLAVPGHILGKSFSASLEPAPSLDEPLRGRRPRGAAAEGVLAAGPSAPASPSRASAHPSAPLRVAGLAFCAAYAAAVVGLTNGLEHLLSIVTPVSQQGADTLAVSLVAFACAHFGKRGLRTGQHRGAAATPSGEAPRKGLEERRNFFELAEEATRVSGDFANAAQALFFAAIGSGTRLADVATIGPAIFGFTLASLVGHLFVHLILCQLFNSFARLKNPLFAIPLDDCLVASEANIGGPGTAATLAGTMLRRPDLIMPAVVWGTVGYLVATSIGIELFSFLTAS
ncbi:conserved hypothetical protein [Neospora caninum Liverpool]|uniref:Transmembrane protein n=1 Tax=Neospora caninum (strain Liverpool) TaxID=572307 RepID=F0VMA7_NEOCL|nr:conserved hypothetical protein [Neospora caninum Liverpool]CBZ54385.1 conserved hypothetical protein [Neospora caninum Liverpool]|eukprot:XP_003884415.1 conserved hypothetical protein [Neospora caninum Liverpool]